MDISFWVIGKTSFDFLDKGIQEYQKRIKRYNSFEIKVIPDGKFSKKMPVAQIKQKEGKSILNKITASDLLILLDERGKSFDSIQFANWLEQKLPIPKKRIVFLIGGAYGFSEAVYERANEKVSLSKMTFSHQLIRLLFVEQLYRAFTIIRNEPYHHQ